MVGAAVFEIVALTKKGDANKPDACVDKFCTPAGKSAAEDAKTFAEVGQWMGIGGLVLVAIGATILITAPSSSSAGAGSAA